MMLDTNTIVSGLGTSTVRVLRRNVGGVYQGRLVCNLTPIASLPYTVTVSSGSTVVSTGIIVRSNDEVRIDGVFTDLNITITPATGNFDTTGSVDLFTGDGGIDLLRSVNGGYNLSETSMNDGSIIVDYSVLEKPRRSILRACVNQRLVLPSSVVVPRMLAGVREKDTVIVTATVDCLTTLGSAFTIDAYGFYLRQENGAPWKLGPSRRLGRATYRFSTAPPTGVRPVAGQFFGTSISYNTTGTATGGPLDNMISAQSQFFLSATAPVYYGTNGRHVIITEVSTSAVGAGGTSTNTLSIGGTAGTLISTITPVYTAPTTIDLPATLPGATGGGPSTVTSHSITMVITNSRASIFVDMGLPNLVHVGTINGKMDVLAIPAITQLQAGVNVRDFTISIVANNDPVVGIRDAIPGTQFGLSSTYSKILYDPVNPKKNVVSVFGIPPTLDFVLDGIIVSDDNLSDDAMIVALESITGGLIPAYGGETTPAIISTTATVSGAYQIIAPVSQQKGPFTLSPYSTYAIYTSGVGKYTVTYNFGY